MNKKKIISMIVSIILITSNFTVFASNRTNEASPIETKAGWKRSDNDWYYFTDSGKMAIGWIQVNGYWYYLDSNGKMQTGWQNIDSCWYYLSNSGDMQTDWLLSGNKWYYLKKSGRQAIGWEKIGSKWYYLKESGAMALGWEKIGGRWYYFSDSGAMQTGWLLWKNNWYYFCDDGKMALGWEKAGSDWYYLNEDGSMATGWKKVNEIWYYLNDSGKMLTGIQTIGGKRYSFNTGGALAEIELSDVLKNAIKPLGKTLYVWGGGWDESDTAAGETAVHDGIWPQWEKYFQDNKDNYSYLPGKTSWNNGNREGRFLGLDCSGYLGWTIYNSIYGGRDAGGYVVKSSKMAETLSEHGYGNSISCTPKSKFYPGDVVSINGHCFLCLGQCKDGSVLILHSTPNGGVQMSGTVSGTESSEAARLAEEFMKNQYPEWWEVFGKENRQQVNAAQYLNGAKFSWQMSGTFKDTKGMQKKTADEVVRYLKESI